MILRDRRFSLIAVAGVTVLALSLAGCGRKGPLEAPNAAVEPVAAGPAGAWQVPAQADLAAAGQAGQRPAGRPYEAATRNAPASTRSSVFDVLID